MSSLDLAALVADVQAEHDILADLLAVLPESSWDEPTPAPGWTVCDQITHLAYFDGITRQAIADPDGFTRFRDAIPDLQEFVDNASAHGQGRGGVEMLTWWAEERRSLLAAALQADPRARVPWFGPSMSLASKLTARLMETWAHGQDVVDALGLDRPPSHRLKHVARIGVLAFGNSFVTRGLEVPDVPIFVALEAPHAAGIWQWGDAYAANRVVGSAEDFCLVVTQRRHVSDTALRIDGDAANAWMAIAQAFAGPPGEGRRPGQFASLESMESTLTSSHDHVK